uniref:NADH dehydrogenase [ubiquinone] 1 alpha subcomplex subunit 12 n=1 Tax=Brassica campestris TaxID=3711 RepID=M4D1S0_BRACM
MSRLWAKVAGLFRSKSFIGADKTGNKYFSRMEEIDVKEKRWVVFRREEDPTSVPVEWICWLNGQRKRAPTPEEMAELEARRERVKLNVARLKREEEERKAREGTGRKITSIGKVEGPDLSSFVRHFPPDSKGITFSIDDHSIFVSLNEKHLCALLCEVCYCHEVLISVPCDKPEEASEEADQSRVKEHEPEIVTAEPPEPKTTEPSGSGSSFRPGTWQPPS